MDTGETHDTVIASGGKGPPKTIEVGWGQGSRWRLVHLSEFHYTGLVSTLALEGWENCKVWLIKQKDLHLRRCGQNWRS